jgi:hypothetical protein
MSGRRRKRERDGDVLKGITAGLVGGLVAGVVMNQFQALWGRLAEGEERGHGAQSLQQGSPEHGAARHLRERGTDEEEMDATERTAALIAEPLVGRELTEAEKEIAGTAVHYAFSISVGAVYGAAAEVAPEITTGAGLPFGLFVWLTADEAAMPLLGLSKTPTEYPPSTHAYALASHLVYGVTAETVRRLVRDAL